VCVEQEKKETKWMKFATPVSCALLLLTNSLCRFVSSHLLVWLFDEKEMERSCK